METIEELFDNVNGGDCVDSAAQLQEMLTECVSTLNKLYLYANGSHNDPKTYRDEIEGLKKQFPVLDEEITGIV